MRIAFLGFGEAARAFRESLAGHDPALRFTAYDILLEYQGADGDCARAIKATTSRSRLRPSGWWPALTGSSAK